MAVFGVHALIYSRKASQARRLFGEVLGWRSVDAGGGWPIYAAPPAELAVHPTESEAYQELYLMCDDLRKTAARLEKRGIRVSRPFADRGWGLVTAIRLPGGGELGLYQPKHPMAISKREVPGRAAGRRGRARRGRAEEAT
jgi:predicted enzyme related to lactoylglutathione lyase